MAGSGPHEPSLASALERGFGGSGWDVEAHTPLEYSPAVNMMQTPVTVPLSRRRKATNNYRICRIEDVFGELDRFTSESMDRPLRGLVPSARLAKEECEASDVRER